MARSPLYDGHHPLHGRISRGKTLKLGRHDLYDRLLIGGLGVVFYTAVTITAKVVEGSFRSSSGGSEWRSELAP